MDFALDFIKTANVKKEESKKIPFEYLNNIYKEDGLRFDEYGNPIYLLGDPEETI